MKLGNKARLYENKGIYKYLGTNTMTYNHTYSYNYVLMYVVPTYVGFFTLNLCLLLLICYHVHHFLQYNTLK